LNSFGVKFGNTVKISDNCASENKSKHIISNLRRKSELSYSNLRIMEKVLLMECTTSQDGDEEMPQSSIFDRFREYELREYELQNLRAEDLVEVIPIEITENHALYEDRILSENLYYINVFDPSESNEFFQNITDIQNVENIANNHVFRHVETNEFFLKLVVSLNLTLS
jgi:hypothetical protein